MRSQILINIVFSASVIGLTGVSFYVIYYTTKLFHIAHSMIITLAAYFVFFFTSQILLPLPIALFLAIIIATITGILCEFLVYRPMRKNNAPLLACLVASIGLYTVLQNIVSMCFGDDVKKIRPGDITLGHEILGAYITTIQVIIISVSVAVYLGISLFLKFTFLGKSMRAVANNLELANIYGINSNKIILVAFVIGSILASMVGILSAMDTNMTPYFGFNLMLYGVVAMIIGGIGNLKGLIVGSILVALAQNLGAYYIDTQWMDAITYIILIIFLAWKPLGYSKNKLKKVVV